MERQAAVYLRTNRKRQALYLGVTNNLYRRDWEHRNGKGGAYSSRYNMTILVWYKLFATIPEAIAEEKRLKGASSADKKRLIDAMNPDWNDIGASWHDAPSHPIASSFNTLATIHHNTPRNDGILGK